METAIERAEVKLPLPGTLSTWVKHGPRFPKSAIWVSPFFPLEFSWNQQGSARAVLLYKLMLKSWCCYEHLQAPENVLWTTDCCLRGGSSFLSFPFSHTWFSTAVSLRTNQSNIILQRNLLFIPSCVPALWEPRSRPGELNPFYRDLSIQ